ncbi:MAG: DUF2203 domain-containing protein [Gemmatimonadales bacterium]|jgi:hypothetical protein
MTEATVKLFTVEEANATLPYVRRIVEDIVADYHRWRDCIYRYELLAGASKSQDGETEEQVALREEVDGIAQRINEFIGELSVVGCIFKGFEGGLVDFRSQRDGREVFLCWKLGEEEVAHWHEVDAGFAGRQPLTPEPVLGESS